jgi:hypothetical protein
MRSCSSNERAEMRPLKVSKEVRVRLVGLARPIKKAIRCHMPVRLFFIVLSEDENGSSQLSLRGGRRGDLAMTGNTRKREKINFFCITCFFSLQLDG